MPMLTSPSTSVLMKPRSSAGRLDRSTPPLKKVSSKDIGIPLSPGHDASAIVPAFKPARFSTWSRVASSGLGHRHFGDRRRACRRVAAEPLLVDRSQRAVLLHRGQPIVELAE